MAQAASKPKLLALESLRGFAALAVVLHHLSYGSPLTQNAFIRHSYLMVDFFFVLSGFVIALNYVGRLSSVAEVATFQRRRFWRLYPLHLFTLLVFLAIECLKFGFEQRTGILSNHPAFTISDGSAFLANLFLLQGVVLDRVTFNVPSWSISTEFWTYLVFALTIGLFRLRASWCLALAAIAGLVVLSLEGGRLETDPIFALVRCIYSFFLGASVAFVALGTKRMPPVAGPAAGPIALAALVACVLAICFLGETRLEILLPLLFAGTIFAVSRLEPASAIRRLLEYPGFVWLGTVSYSIYMTHSIVGWGMTQVLRFGFRLPTEVTPDGDTMLVLGPWLATFTVGLAVAAVLALSALTYRFIEQPFLGGWPFGRQRVVAKRA